MVEKQLSVRFAVKDGNKAKRDLKDIGRDGSEALKRIEAAGQEAGTGLMVLNRSVGMLSGALATIGGVSVLGTLIADTVRAGDALAGMEARLTALTGSGGAARDVLSELQRIGLQTGVALEDSAAGFGRFTLAAKDIGATRAETLRLVEAVQKLGAIAGTSSAETSGAMIQLAQALASGKLQGDEMRSIMETMPTLAKQIADGLGVSMGRLRQMGADGELTADKIFAAILKGADAIDKKFAEMPATAERELGQLAVAWQGLLASLDKKLEGSSFYKLMIGGARRTVQDIQGFIDPSLDQQYTKALDRFQQAAAERDRLASASMWNGGNPFQRDMAEREYQAARRELDSVQALILKEAELAAERQRGEKASAEAAEADAERNRNLEARKKLLSDSLPLMKAAAEHDQKVTEAARLFGEGVLTQAEYLKIYEAAEADYAAAADKATGASKTARDAEQARQKVVAEGQQVYERTRTSGEAYADEVKRLEGLLRDGAISQDTFSRAVANAASELQVADQHIQDYLANIRSMQTEADRIRAETRTPDERYQGSVERYSDLYNAGMLDDETLNRALAGAWDDYTKALEKADDKSKELKHTTAELSHVIGTAFEDAVVQGKGLSEVLLGLAQDIQRVILRAAITKPIENAIGGMVGSMFSGFMFANGGIMTGAGPLPLRTYSTGGIANSPQLALYGEGSKPEAYVPLPDGRSIPVSMQGGSGTVINQEVNVTVNGANGSNAEDNAALAEQLSRRIQTEMRGMMQEEIRQQMRPGGMFNSM